MRDRRNLTVVNVLMEIHHSAIQIQGHAMQIQIIVSINNQLHSLPALIFELIPNRKMELEYVYSHNFSTRLHRRYTQYWLPVHN